MKFGPSKGKFAFQAKKTTLVLSLASMLFPALLQAAHPLITEDTGTQGQNKFQLELTTEQGHEDENFANRHSRKSSAALSYGIRDNIDAIVTAPYKHVSIETNGEVETHNGLADTALDVKWRFFEKENLSLALKPGVTFPNGDETKGLGTGKSAYSLYFITTFAPEPWALHLHLGYLRNRSSVDERENIWHASVGGWRTMNKNIKLAFDMGRTTNTDKTTGTAPAFAILGLIYSPQEYFDWDFGVKKGLTGPETDYSLLAGMTFRF